MVVTNRNPARSRRRKKIAFGWYGGKFSHLDFLLPNLPNDATHFCDVFGGSAAVLINREPAPVETYNDLDSELVNFFATLRHAEDGERLIEGISLTPFSREELALACTFEDGLDKVERARRFYVRPARREPAWHRLHHRAAGRIAYLLPVQACPVQCLVG